MALVDTHIGFVEALRSAGLSVSLAEGLDAVDALARLPWDDRETVRAAYAATLVKRQAQRVTFDAVFDLFFPPLVGEGVRRDAGTDPEVSSGEGDPPDPADPDPREGEADVRDNAAALARFRDELAQALVDGDEARLRELSTEAVGRFGAMPGRGAGLSSWSAYTALQRVTPAELTAQLVRALTAPGSLSDDAERAAGRRIGAWVARVEDDARRRIAEEKGAQRVVDVVVRPTIDRLDFTAARRADLAEMRRQIQPLTRRLATRLTQEHHARRRGPLDFRRTVRASVSTGGVPLTTHHRPRRPHRSELVVLCDVSGSVANFAQFTLLLVHALRDHFQGMRAFTFIDHVAEVTHHFTPGADAAQVMADLAASTSHAALWGRTNYGRALTKFAELHGDAVGPKTALLVLGDARSNHSDLAVPVLRDLAGSARHAWWLNPEHRRHWGTGDSAAPEYAAVVPMVECRNLTQLEAFVHDLV